MNESKKSTIYEISGIVVGILAVVLVVSMIFSINDRFDSYIDSKRDDTIESCEELLETKTRYKHSIILQILNKSEYQTTDEQQQLDYKHCIDFFENGHYEKWIKAGDQFSNTSKTIFIILPFGVLLALLLVFEPWRKDDKNGTEKETD